MARSRWVLAKLAPSVGVVVAQLLHQFVPRHVQDAGDKLWL
jgi:hypothetical protein